MFHLVKLEDLREPKLVSGYKIPDSISMCPSAVLYVRFKHLNHLGEAILP